MGRQPHVLVIAYPAQGIVGPLMKLSQQIAKHGVKVTFVNTEFIHARILAALPEKNKVHNLIQMVSISDGLEQGDDRKDALKLGESIQRVMPARLEDLVRKFNSESIGEKITCVIADVTLSWALEIGRRYGIKGAMFWPSTVGSFAVATQLAKLIEDGIIDCDGTLIRDEVIQLTEDMPTMNTTEFVWACPGNPKTQKMLFKYNFSSTEAVKIASWLLCNSFDELEPPACKLIPDLLPVGPLLQEDELEISAANFWPEDLTCLNWLNRQKRRSVIYVAFGSIAILSQQQIEELALGLELAGQPFLWVVRSDLIDRSTESFINQFIEKLGDQGKIIRWAPQEKVLAHPSIACFLTHCGWNSTLEGLRMGVSFLCWPFCADQFHIRSYICDIWKLGVNLYAEKNGIISRDEIRRKTEILLSDGGIRANVLKLKKMARDSVSEGGSSLKNLKKFIAQIRD